MTDLRRAWEKERTAMLNDGTSRSKGTNIEISIKISLDSKPVRANPTALRLLTLICLLPDGAKRVKIGELTRVKGTDSAVRTLKLSA